MSQHDQIAALMLFSTAETFAPGSVTEDFGKAARGVANNSPDFYRQLDLEGENVAWRDMVGNEAIAVPVGRRLFSHWLNPWAAKQTCAMWYEQSGQIFDTNQRILVRWITNPLEIKDDFLTFLRANLAGTSKLAMGTKDFQDQFMYLFGIDDKKQFGAFFAIFHNAVAVFSIVAPAEYFANDPRVSYGELFCTGPNNGITRTLH